MKGSQQQEEEKGYNYSREAAGGELTDEEQEIEYRKNKCNNRIYHGVKKYKKEGLYIG